MSEQTQKMEAKPELKLVELGGHVLPLTGIGYVEKQYDFSEEVVVTRRNRLRRAIETKTERTESFNVFIAWRDGFRDPYRDVTLAWDTEAERDAAYDGLIAALNASGVLAAKEAGK